MTSNITLPTRMAAIDAHRAQGGLTAAVFPVHYPKALFRAHGILPIEVWGPPQVDPSPADAHLPSYTCSVIRHSMAYLLGGKLDIVDMLVVPHCCDTLQGFGSILLDFVSHPKPVLPFYLPRGDRKSDIDFLTEEIELIEVLEDRVLDKIINNDDIDRNQKTGKIRNYLKKKRYPAITAAEAEFLKNLKELNLDNTTRLIPPKDFEGMTYSMNMSFNNIQELKERKELLEKVLQNPVIKNILY